MPLFSKKRKKVEKPLAFSEKVWYDTTVSLIKEEWILTIHSSFMLKAF